MRSAAPRLLLVLAALALAAAPAIAGLDDADFRKAKSSAKKLWKKPGEYVEKKATIAKLGVDEAPRSLEVLVEWAVQSAALVDKKLGVEAKKRRAVYDEYRQKVLKKRGGEGGWSDGERSKAAKRKASWKEANDLVIVEANVQGDIAAAIKRAKDKESVAWLMTEGMPKLLAVTNGLEPVLDIGVRKMLTLPPSVAGKHVLTAVTRRITPDTRIRALEWIGLELIPDSATRVAECLKADSVPVRRAAVRTLKVLDDPRAVPVVIENLDKASGLLASEMEELLHYFTGQTFSASGAAWQAWFKDKGAAWMEQAKDERHEGGATRGEVDFYGIPTPSNRIVFLLDRSGSMETPAMDKVEQKGPVTGDGENGGHESGQTKLQVAKAELRRAINQLGIDVKFNVVFYNHKVEVWKGPPELVQASRENKAKAREWFMAQEPKGSTELFAGLMKALDYGSKLEKAPKSGQDAGVDTIFLLSDGAPTTGIPARLLTDEEIEKNVVAFLKANEQQRCVVHTIGVGPLHNKELMKRLARETGGKYIAVGVKDPNAEKNAPAKDAPDKKK